MATANKAVEASDIVEDVKELVEDTSEWVEVKASWLVRNPKAVVLAATLAGAAAGAALTYMVASKRLETKYQQLADQQIEDVKNHYSVLRKDDVSLEDLANKYPDEEKTVDAAVVDRIITREGYTSYDKVPTTVEPEEVSPIVDEAVTRNVFESDHPDTYFDPDEEAKRRETKPNEPFVITAEEFNENKPEYDQQSLTYYDGDDVLAAQDDSPIPEIDKTIGFENLLRFGHGSGDPSVVYIRNNRLELDFEVSHSDGKFAKEVLGFDDELRHSDRRPRKFRPRDE